MTKCRLGLMAVIASLVCFGASFSYAQKPPEVPYVWKSVKVGAGGFIPGIVFSRVEKGLVYLRSDMGGFYRWDDSAHTWIPLQDSMRESSYFGGESIAPDPIDPNVVYAAAGMYRGDPSAMLRSSDQGKTWEIFPVSFKMGGNEDGRGVGERLAVDPNDHRILYFGSRHDGLWRSTDFAKTWTPVRSFPVKGLGLSKQTGVPHVGLSFVVFDATSGKRGQPTPTIFVGSTDPKNKRLYRSDDAGTNWKPVNGGPNEEFLPAQAQIDDDGQFLYITYGNGAGPNGVTDGSVMKLEVATGNWTDITPDKRPDRPKGGYCGLSLDRLHPGTLGVTTMNRWGPVDTVWRSNDAGKTWLDIVKKSQRDVSATPFLLWGKDQPRLGWWMAAFAIDPFDSDHAAYSTGATIFATNDFSKVSSNEPTHWHPWVEGIEQTAVIAVMSPSEGPHLLSGFGDIGGFVHDDLNVSPPTGMYENPQFGNTTTLDYAGLKPNIIVRSGEPADNQAALGYSEDGGHTWKPIIIPRETEQRDTNRRRDGHPPIVTSADGSIFIVMTHRPIMTRDHGQTWMTIKGLPPGDHPIADRAQPQTFYAIDFATGKMFLSTDGGENFTPSDVSGLPDIHNDAPTWREAPWPLAATPGKPGDMWLFVKDGLFHSTDAGKRFAKSPAGLHVEAFSFGKAPPGSNYPALFAYGTINGLRAVWRSDDAATSWLRINDDNHQYGTRFRCISGDPRVFGRVYIGTDGRGLLYADPAS